MRVVYTVIRYPNCTGIQLVAVLILYKFDADEARMAGSWSHVHLGRPSPDLSLDLIPGDFTDHMLFSKHCIVMANKFWYQ
jgi:hypothetical protein